MRQTNEVEGYETIAIIGMAGQFPGAKNVDELWDNLCNGVELVSFFSAEELQSSGVDPALLNDPTFVNAGAVMDDADCFDAAFFGITPREAEIMDPQHRVFLECAWAALEHAGYDPGTYRAPIGVFGGVGPNTYFQYNLASQPELLETVGSYQAMIGNAAHFPTTRVSYKLNLKGPSLNVQTACSTSGVAIHLACQSLLSGECDMALAGGARIKVPLKSGYFYQPDGIPSPDGRCRAFDAQAQGTVYGSGGAVVVLKRLSDAVRDRDSIYAVIKGSAINNDGAVKVGFTAPSVQGQAAAIAEAYAIAGISAGSLSYIEAHGTGTALGDPIEIAALTRAFRETTDKKQFCAIGSLKTNIGHLDAGAGVASVIKTALALKHKLIPPSLNFTEPNPQIDFQNSPFYVNTTLSEWKAGSIPRRAGVSSFGLGGTNVHIVLEEPPVTEPPSASRPWQLLVLSAKTSTALDVASKRLAEYLQRHPDMNLADVAYTCSLGRQPFSHRRIAVCRDVADAVRALGGSDPKRVVTQFHEGNHKSIVFMFPGGGAQYVDMGRELYEHESAFREHVDECLALLKPHVPTDLRPVLFPSVDGIAAATQLIEQPPIALPLLFTLEWAMAKLLMSWGIQPSAMIGHSMGEYTAACLAGVISLADALALVALRGRLFATLPAGAMLSIPAPEEAVRALMGKELSIAAINKPSSCVVSGEVHAIEELERRLTEKGTDYGRVHIAVAAHSQMVDPILAEFGRFVENVALRAPNLPYVSNVTGTWITPAEATDPAYWVKHLRQTVRFSDGLHVLMQETGGVLLEVGPGQTLSTFARQHPDKTAEQAVISTVRHIQEQASDVAFLLKAVGRLWLTGVEVGWPAVYCHERRQRVALPTYPFERKRYWIDPPRAVDEKPMTKNGQEAFSHRAQEQETPQPSQVISKEEQISMSSESQTSAGVAPSRKETIVATLKEILEHLSGVAASALDEHATFLEMGFDSLFLTRANVAFVKKFAVKITFRQLFRECPTLDALAAYIDSKLPPEPVVPELPRTAPVPEPKPVSVALPPAAASPSRPVAPETSQRPAHEAASADVLERVISQQLRLMSEQLEMLRNGRPAEAETGPAENRQSHQSTEFTATTAAPAVPRPDKTAATNVVPVTVDTAPRKPGPQTPANWRPPRRGGRGELTPRQRQYLEALTARYTSRTRESKRLTQLQRRHMSDPISVSGFNAHWKEMVYQIAIARASGSRCVDVDGNEYVDLTMSFSVNLFGHSPSFITRAVEKQLRQSLGLGTLSPLTRRVAELVCEITGMERTTFLTTGSEANMAALRAARLVTGRDKFAVFGGAYHGVFDEVLIKAVRGNGQLRPEPVAPGIPERAVEDVLVLDYGDPQSLNLLQGHGDRLAAVFVEAVQSRHPDLQPRQFLHALREITAQKGIALIFDEIITGFRLHPKGAQGWYGVQADMASYGKLIGGGLPMSALAGKALYMDAFDGGPWSYGDDSFPEAGVTFFAGTFMKHPLSLAAAAAVLDHLQQSGPRLQQELNERSSQFVKALNGYFVEQRVAIWVEHCGSMLYFTFPDNNELARLLFYTLREKGVHIWDRPVFLSTAHTDEDLAFIIRAVRESVAEMKAAGILEEQPGDPPHGRNGAAFQRNGATPTPSEPTIVLTNGSRATALESAAAGGDGRREVPTTESQLEIWTASQMSNDASCAFNLSYSIHLRGQLQQQALRQALQQVIDRHDSLRATFSPDGERMRIAPLTIDFPVLDYSGPERDTKVNELLANEVLLPFDLVNDQLVRAHLVRLEEQHHLLVLTVHHIVCDGFSSGTVVRDLGTFYSAACRGSRAELTDAMQFSEYARAQHAEKTEEEFAAAEEYWMQRYTVPPPALALPSDRPRPPVKTFASAEQHWTIDKVLCANLRRVGASHGCTLFSTLLSGYVAFLHRLTGQNDIVVATPASGQLIVGRDDLVGHCVNLQPSRCHIDGGQTFTEFLASVQGMVLDTYEHRKYTVGNLLKKLKLSRDPSRLPLFSTQFNLEPDKTGLDFHGLNVEVSFNRRRFYTHDIGLNVVESGGELKLRYEYNTDLFDADTIRRWAGNFQTLLEGIAANPDEPIGTLPLLTPAERRQLLVEWNATERDYPLDRRIHQLVEAQVERTPEAVAVECGGQKLTYRDLNVRANQLAHYLQHLGVGPEICVGLCLKRSLDLLVGVLGILKAGGAYLPLDPTYPSERLAFMMEDSQLSVLLTHSALRAELPPGPMRVVELDTDWATIAQHPAENLPWTGTADAVAYILYTSGSTGQPKGVLGRHRGLVNRFCWMWETYPFSPDEVTCQKTALGFIDSLWELLGSLPRGIPVVLVPDEVTKDPAALVETLSGYRVTRLVLAPSLLQTLLDTVPNLATRLPKLRLWTSSGEALSVELAQRFHELVPHGTLLNLYGSSEVTADATAYEVPKRIATTTRIPIGRPIANTKVYVLDTQLQPVPLGVRGELYVGGAGLARGYHQRHELTSARFVRDPFSEVPGACLYKTGDEVRCRADGNLEFLGRNDDQVKIRGFRVELGEIEAVLRRHPAVQQVVTILREDTPGNKTVVAYVVPTVQQTPSTSDLYGFLRTRLPDYMVPSAFVLLDALPLNPNGKVDRRALPAPDHTPGETAQFVAPQSTLEVQLTKIWEQVLGRSPIGVKDNFFDLGGNSLLVVRAVAQIVKTVEKDLSVAAFFQHPTIEGLATLLQQQGEATSVSRFVTLQQLGSRLPFFCISGWVALARYVEPDQPFYMARAYGYDGGKAPSTIEAMASGYLEEVRKIQPQGPYFLGGHSYGGLVAFEMAQQLSQQGHSVALLVLLDPSLGRDERSLRSGNHEAHFSPFTYSRLLPFSPQHHGQRLKQLNRGQQLRYVRQEVQEKLTSKLKFFMYRALLSAGRRVPLSWRGAYTYNLHIRAIHRYRAKPYHGRTVLFTTDLHPAHYRAVWQRRITHGLEVYDIPGSHLGMFEEEHLRFWAPRFADVLQRAQNECRMILTTTGTEQGRLEVVN